MFPKVDSAERNRLRKFLPTYLVQLGVDARDVTSGRFRCPFHDDTVASAGFAPRAPYPYFHCFVCGDKVKGDIISVIQRAEGCSAGEAIGRARQIAGSAPPPSIVHSISTRAKQSTNTAEQRAKNRRIYEVCKAKLGHTDHAVVQYLARRGISLETARRWELGAGWTFCEGNQSNALVWQTDDGGLVFRACVDFTSERYRVKGTNSTTHRHWLLDEGALFICEGAFDALALEELGFRAMALNSVDNVPGLLRAIDKVLAKTPGAFKATPIVCLDNDKAGDEAAKKLVAGLMARGLAESEKRNRFCVHDAMFDDGEVLERIKDAGEWLVYDRRELEVNAARAVEYATQGKETHTGRYYGLSEEERSCLAFSLSTQLEELMTFENEHVVVRSSSRTLTVYPANGYTLDTGWFSRWQQKGRGYRMLFDSCEQQLDWLQELREAIGDGRVFAYSKGGGV